MFVNIIRTYRNVVAVCDTEILGKTFEEGDFRLDVKESFYKGKEMPEEEAMNLMKKMKLEDATFNIAGKEAIKTAINAGVISEESVKKIQNIPYSLVLI